MARVTRPAPTLGQHTREVLTELGKSAQEIDALYASGVVRCEATASTINGSAAIWSRWECVSIT